MEKYKIGNVARILGISPDLLRYYEKKGVVKPTKDVHNDYRYYDFWDINFLLDCLWFKNFGFSIEQISEMVRIPSAEELSSLFEEKGLSPEECPAHHIVVYPGEHEWNVWRKCLRDFARLIFK